MQMMQCLQKRNKLRDPSKLNVSAGKSEVMVLERGKNCVLIFRNSFIKRKGKKNIRKVKLKELIAEEKRHLENWNMSHFLGSRKES